MSEDSSLTSAQRAALQALAGIIVPADAELDVPGADDPAIEADMLATLGRDAGLVRAALEALARLAGGAFADLEPGRREAIALEWRARGGEAAAVLTRVVLQCYYRDDRVLRSLGLEPRPPYPLGHVLEDGDWSLLDAVRARPPFWRQA